MVVAPERTHVDAYEQKYMAGHGRILFRDKRPAPRWMQLLLASTAFVGGVVLLTPQWLLGLALLPLGALMWILFSVLRLTISERAVSIQYGLFGPTIPMTAIESVAAVDYSWTTFGGWGIRRSLGGEWMYNMPGDGGRAVRIVWRKGNKRCVTHVGTPDADTAARAIAAARRSLDRPPPVAGELESPSELAIGPGEPSSTDSSTAR